MAVLLQEPVQLEMRLTRGLEQTPVTSETMLIVGETVNCILDLRIDATYAEEHVVSRWRRAMDLQFELETPWIEGGVGMEVLPWRPVETDSGATLVIDREPGFLESGLSEDGVQTFHLQRRILITEAAWELQPAVLHWTSAEAFEGDLVRGRVPQDPVAQTSQSAPWRMIAINPPVPSPPGFRGAIGDFQSQATFTSQDENGILEMEWSFHGFGALDRTKLPVLSKVVGAHVQAQRLEETADGLVLHLELQARDGAGDFQLPSWVVFDPVQGVFLSHHAPTQRLDDLVDGQVNTLEVTPLSSDKTAAPDSVSTHSTDTAVTAQEGHPPPLAETQLPTWIVPLILGSSLMIGVILILVARRRPPGQRLELHGAAMESPAHRISKAPKPRLADAPPAQPSDFFDHLAVYLGVSRETLYRDDLPRRLQACDLPENLATSFQDAVHRQRDALFAGQGDVLSKMELQDLLDRLRKAST